MVESLAIQIVLVIFGILLTVITGLMGWQALAIISAGKSIAVLESLLKEISEDLKKIGHHDSLIAVLENKVINLKSEVELLFEKTKELERDSYENNSLRGRQ